VNVFSWFGEVLRQVLPILPVLLPLLVVLVLASVAMRFSGKGRARPRRKTSKPSPSATNAPAYPRWQFWRRMRREIVVDTRPDGSRIVGYDTMWPRAKYSTTPAVKMAMENIFSVAAIVLADYLLFPGVREVITFPLSTPVWAIGIFLVLLSIVSVVPFSRSADLQSKYPWWRKNRMQPYISWVVWGHVAVIILMLATGRIVL